MLTPTPVEAGFNGLSRQISRTVLELRFDISGSAWEQDILLSADRHLDNVDTDRQLQKAHLIEAGRRRAPVLDFGDMFCAMQGKGDKRSSKSKLRPEDKETPYLDRIVETNANFLEPYAKQFALIAVGNHETSILKHHETDLTDRLVTVLNDRTGAKIARGGYSGFVRFQFNRGEHRQSLILYYHHGTGAGGIVTKGVIQTNRRAAHVDADIFATGHIHESWCMEIPRLRLNKSNVIEQSPGWHIQLPSYKEEYQDGEGGFHVERGQFARPLGAYWLRFYYDYSRDRVCCEPRKARN